MPDATKAQRQLDLKARFEEGASFTVEGMMSEYGITRRTANRDLLDLGAAGLELAFDEIDNGVRLWHAAMRAQKYRVTYSLTELMALFLGRRFFDFLSGTILEEQFDRVLSRVESQLGRREHRVEAGKLGKKLYLVHEGPKKLEERNREILDEILTGLLKEQKLRVRYTSAKGTAHELTLRPYTLVAFKRGLYLLAAVEEWNGVVARFALERVERADWMKDERFDYPETFDPENYLENALFLQTGDPAPVEIVFNAGTRPFVEHCAASITFPRDDNYISPCSSGGEASA